MQQGFDLDVSRLTHHRWLTTCPISSGQIVLQCGEWTQEHINIAHRPTAETEARELLTAVQVLFILDLVVRREKQEEVWAVGSWKNADSPHLPHPTQWVDASANPPPALDFIPW